ncbi:MAG: GntR family transcriptional regulator [Victivallales bacterium]|jgi:DNA-binding LacI/PurR family transcriptional regulator
MLNSDNQTAECCRAIIRFANGNKLQSGDKLPSQNKLCSALGFCHNTMTPAMDMLVDSGMFTRKRRVGTVLVDPTSYPHGIWRLAIPHGPFDGNPGCKFGAILSMSIQSHLQKRNCDVRLYQRLPEYADVSPHSLEHFANLAQDIENARLDAILTPAFFSKETSRSCARLKIPLCHVGGWEQTPCRVELNECMLLEKAIEYLRSKACRHIALITMDNFEQISPKLFSTFRKYSDSKGKSGFYEFIPAKNVLDGERIVSKILLRDSSRRPDALIILNDLLGLGVASAMNGSAYKPKIAIQTSRQMPLFYSIPVIRFEFDVDMLAEQAAGLIISKLLHPDTPDTVIAQTPELRINKLTDNIEDAERIISA